MTPTTPLPWKPISEIPDDRLDGREVLIWREDLQRAVTAEWDDGKWIDGDYAVNFDGAVVTYWADLTPPDR